MLEQQANRIRASRAGKQCELTGWLSLWADAILEFPEQKYNLEPEGEALGCLAFSQSCNPISPPFFFFSICPFPSFLMCEVIIANNNTVPDTHLNALLSSPSQRIYEVSIPINR